MDDIAASLRSKVERELEKLRRSAAATKNQLAARGLLLSGAAIAEMRRLGIEAYRQTCALSVEHLAQLEGRNAANHGDVLADILTEAQHEFVEAADFNTLGRGDQTIAAIIANQVEGLRGEMARAVSDGRRDLRLSSRDRNVRGAAVPHSDFFEEYDTAVEDLMVARHEMFAPNLTIWFDLLQSNDRANAVASHTGSSADRPTNQRKSRL